MSTNPTSVQQIALQRAITLLKAAKVEYAIRTEDGTVLGDLPIAPPEKKRGGWKKENDFESELHYIDQIKNMKPGDVLQWEMGPRWRKFQSALGGTAGRYLPKGGFITTVADKEKGLVEILRVE